jgi:ABC-type multidrug transport system fused ATPase/permease subunit
MLITGLCPFPFQLPMQWNQLLTLVFNVFGTIGLVRPFLFSSLPLKPKLTYSRIVGLQVFYTYVLLFLPPIEKSNRVRLKLSLLGRSFWLHSYPLLGIIFVPMAILYYGFATFYRQSSREIKRIDSVLRSHIYSSFGEMLTGLASVRAYGSQALFMDRTETAVDVENVSRIAHLSFTPIVRC